MPKGTELQQFTDSSQHFEGTFKKYVPGPLEWEESVRIFGPM